MHEPPLPLIQNLKNLLQNDDAVEFCSSLFTIAQGFDDIKDNETEKVDVYGLMWCVLFKFGENPFYLKHKAFLQPLMASMLLQWQSANVIEQTLGDLHKSYMLRAFFYQICHFCALLLHGSKYAQEQSLNFQMLYGESFENYRKEFTDA